MTTEADDGTRGPGWPRALLIAIALAMALEGLALGCQERFADTVPLLYAAKLRAASDAPPTDLVVLGDSSAVAALRPRELAEWLPPGVQSYNLALPAAGPSGGEVALGRWLRHHPAPALLVVSYTPITLAGEPAGLFERYPLAHLFAARDLWRTTRRTGDYGYWLPWLATRPASVRHREALQESAIAALLDRFPSLREPLRGAFGYRDHAIERFRFEWLYTERAGRNQRFLEDLADEKGWHYFREEALHDEVLPDGAVFEEAPFAPAAREVAAFDMLLSAAVLTGSRVLVLPVPLPGGRLRAVTAGNGAEQWNEFWRERGLRHPEIVFPAVSVLPMRHEYFADRGHLNPAGRARYLERVGPLLAAGYSRSER